MTERHAVDQQAEQHEQPLILTFLEWVAALKIVELLLDLIAAAIRAGSWALLQVQMLLARPLALDLLPAAIDEAERGFRLAVARGGSGLDTRFNVRDPLLDLSVEQHAAQDAAAIVETTREAIRLTIQDAHRSNWEPHVFAPQVHSMIGLTPRQARAVVNLTNAQLEEGVKPELVVARAERYAKRLLGQRAVMIGRTENSRAANLGRLAGYRQAAANGLVPRERSFLEWRSVQTDPKEVCFQLNGRRVPLEQGNFDGFFPPVHPDCRCIVHLVVV